MFFCLTKRTKFLVRVRLFNKRTNTNELPAERFTNCSPNVCRKSRTANLSKNLIALLSVGGVPKNYFLELLENTLQDAQKVSSSLRAALRGRYF
ncbi:putative RNA-dependent RNA polymerase, eukaryotic-type [Helianthus anomalus]